MYAQRNDIGAAFALAAPMENPLLPGVDVAMITEPLGFLVAREDNSITELGNNLIRSNFTEAAHAAGFADQPHFARDFRRRFGAPASPGLSSVRRRTKRLAAN